MKYIVICFFVAAVDCGDLNNPDNGMVSLDGTRLNSVATYQCNTGYDLMGDTERRCTELGQWSGSQPVCQSKSTFTCKLRTSTELGTGGGDRWR